jgi:hypothetical protein
MLISKKQQAANQQNAQHSTGPKTPEGKAAVRFNALTWSLRAQSLITPRDNPADYQQLWDALAAEWQPQTESEGHFLEQMSIARWLLTRTADSERRVYEANLPLEKELALLDRVSVRRVRLERSFTAAMHELERLQLKRQANRQPRQSESTAKTAASPREPAHHPDYVMSEGAEAHPVSCAPATPDTR